MNLKWIFIISCLILSTYARTWSSKPSTRSRSASSFGSIGSKRGDSSFGSNKGKSSGSLGRVGSSVARPPKRLAPENPSLINSQHKPRIPSAPPLPPPKSPQQPKKGSQIPAPPPPPPPPPPAKLHFENSGSSAKSLNPSTSSSFTGITPLATRGLLAPALIRRKNATTTSSGNPSKSSDGFAAPGIKNSTVQANLSIRPPAHLATSGNRTANPKGSPFNATTFQSGNSKNVTGNSINLGGNTNMTSIAKVNQTLTGNGIPRGSGFASIVPLNNTRRNFTLNSNGSVNYTGNGVTNAQLFNATRLNNTSKATENPGFNGNGFTTGGQAPSTSNINIVNINKNYPPTEENMPWNGNPVDNSGQNNDQGTPSKSQSKTIQDFTKKALKGGIKQFATKHNDSPERASYTLTNNMNGRSFEAHKKEYSWKTSVENKPKPASTKMRNQIIIVATCIMFLLIAAGVIAYMCNRKQFK